MMKELALLDFSKTQVLQLFSDEAVLDPLFGPFFQLFLFCSNHFRRQ